MSLFQAIEYWRYCSDNEETFDQNSLKISKLNGVNDLIITGSHSGILRVFAPCQELNESNELEDFKPTNLLLEKDFKDAIIQIETGKLVSGSHKIQLAILNSKIVRILSFLTKTGEIEHGNQYMFKQMYEHNLRRAASNFVVGSFGESAKRDFICVQSLDGLLTFFEQECFSFCCFLPNFLLPGPIIYLNYVDCFITAGSTWMLQCFTYKSLSDAGESSSQEDISGKRISECWTFNIGEEIFNMMALCDDDKKENYILSLSRKHLYCCDGRGKLRFMKRLDCPTSSLNAYLLGDERKVILSLIVSETKTLLVYGNSTLMWSAQLSFLPVALSRAFFLNVKGSLVMLSEEGKLHCTYLGTEPHLFTAFPLSNRQLDLDKSEEELTRLYRIIRSRLNNEISQKATTSNESVLSVKIIIDPQLIQSNKTSYEENLVRNLLVSHVIIEVIPHLVFEEIQITAFVKRPLKVSKETELYVSNYEKIIFECDVFVEENLEVFSIEFTAVISCVSSVSFPRVIQKTTTLPLKMFFEAYEQQKGGDNKIILDLNKDPLPLTQLFQDFLLDDEKELYSSSNVLTFRSINCYNEPVTISLSNSSPRYRLQSNCLGSLNIFLTYMKKRLLQLDSSFVITYSANLPTDPLLLYAREHFQVVEEIKRSLDLLNQLSTEYRAIEKELITKFKDKNPTPMVQFLSLIDDSYEDINESLKGLKYEEGKLNKVGNNLEGTLSVVINLVQVMGIPGNLLELVESVFQPHVYNMGEQNWEDTIDASLCYLLRTSLYKSEKDKLETIHVSFQDIKEFTKLEEHLTQVFERISSSGKNVKIDETIQNEIEDIITVEDKQNSPKQIQTTIGSQYGESSLRAISAKKSLLKRRYKVSDVI